MWWPSPAPSAGLEELDDRVKAAGLPGAGGLTLAPMDVTNEDAMRHLCRSIHDRWGGLQLWVHTAIHVTALSPSPSIDMKDLDKSIATNLRATAFLMTMVEPLLRAGQGTAMLMDDPAAAKPLFRRLRHHQGRADATGPQLAGRDRKDRPPRADRHARARCPPPPAPATTPAKTAAH